MGLLDDLLKIAFPLILKGLKEIADAQVDGATLSLDQKRLVYAGYVLINVKFKDLVEDTANEYDDDTLDALADLLSKNPTKEELVRFYHKSKTLKVGAAEKDPYSFVYSN